MMDDCRFLDCLSPIFPKDVSVYEVKGEIGGNHRAIPSLGYL